MPNTIQCPHCANSIAVDAQSLASASSIRCTACGSTIQMTLTPTLASSAASVPPAQASDTAQPKRRGLSAVAIVSIVLGSGFCVLLLICGVTGFLISRSMAAMELDQKNMKRIGIAMHNYESMYRRFPAPASLDANGKPEVRLDSTHSKTDRFKQWL